MLRRKIDQKLLAWKNDSQHLPLIVKGARQVGKTESIRQFGKQICRNVIEINFVLQNIGFNGQFYTFPYFLGFLLKRFLKERKI